MAVSYDANPACRPDGTYEFSFSGLSSDTKPTESYKHMPIANGSTFLEMDTQELKFYDGEGKAWV